MENKLSYAFQRYHVDDNFHTAFSIIRNISKKVYLHLKRNKLSNIITVNIIVDIMMIIIKIPCVRLTDGRVLDKLGPEQTNGAIEANGVMCYWAIIQSTGETEK